jgi:hypothetical protein
MLISFNYLKIMNFFFQKKKLINYNSNRIVLLKENEIITEQQKNMIKIFS